MIEKGLRESLVVLYVNLGPFPIEGFEILFPWTVVFELGAFGAIPVVDETGKVVQHVLKPFMVEFRPRDLMQVIVGASLLAVPIAFTEETWKLGENLPLLNIGILAGISLFFIAVFVYVHFYRFYRSGNSVHKIL